MATEPLLMEKQMDSSHMVRWAKKGAQYGLVAAGGLAALGVIIGPRSIVLPVAGIAALPTFLGFLHWRAEYYGPLNEWVTILPCIVANWALVGGVAGWVADRIGKPGPAVDSQRVANLERVVNDLGSDIAQLQAQQEFDRQLAQPVASTQSKRTV